MGSAAVAGSEARGTAVAGGLAAKEKAGAAGSEAMVEVVEKEVTGMGAVAATEAWGMAAAVGAKEATGLAVAAVRGAKARAEEAGLEAGTVPVEEGTSRTEGEAATPESREAGGC